MRALLRGQRVASPLMMGALVGMCAVALAGLFLAVGYRSQFVDLKHVIYTRCSQRTAYDTANHASVGADVTLYRSLLAAGLRPTQQAAIRTALATKQRAYNAGVIGSCNAYK